MRFFKVFLTATAEIVISGKGAGRYCPTGSDLKAAQMCSGRSRLLLKASVQSFIYDVVGMDIYLECHTAMKGNIERLKSSLPVDEDVSLHIVGWIIQRIAWAMMLVILVCAGLGLFGNGILSSKRVAGDRANIVYERFLRYENKTELAVEAAGSNGTIEIEIPLRFIENFEVESIMPAPESQTVLGESIAYQFQVAGKGKVIFFISPKTQGSVQGTVKVNGTELFITSYIYP